MFKKNRLWTYFFSDARAGSRAFRINLIICLGLVGFLFVSLLDQQNKATNPNLVRANLKATGQVLELGSWQAQFHKCDEVGDGNVRSCLELETKSPTLDFPAKDSIESLLNGMPEKPTTAVLKYKLSETDRRWIADKAVVVLLIPRSVQNSIKLRTESGNLEAHGLGINASFPLHTRELLDRGEIRLEFDFDGFTWFGPADLPLTLATPDAVPDYESLYLRQISAANLSRQMEIGFPLLLAAIAIVLDHSILFGFLSLYAGARAVRTYIPFLDENGTRFANVIEHLQFAINGLTFAFLVLFVAEISNLNKRRWKVEGLFVIASVCLFSLGGLLDKKFWVSADLWSDFLSCGIALPISAFGLYKVFADRRKDEELKNPHAPNSYTGLSLAILVMRNLVVLVALGVHGWANASDLFKISTIEFKNMLDWKHSLLFPALITAALMEVGSTARKMVVFGKEMAAKALIEKDLAVGKEVQQRMLPASRYRDETFAWRSFYYPATALAGDWFDVRILHFPQCGRRLLAACIADVTGHGVGSSLATSVISSHWGLWCQDVESQNFPDDESVREVLLAQAPKRVNAGLLALRKNENGTAIFMLLDPVTRAMTLCSASHPGAFISDGSNVRYVFTSGERLGVDNQNTNRWNVKTDILAANEIVCLYSDGIVPPDMTVSQWAMALRRLLRKGPQPLVRLLARQIRANRKSFKLQRDIEDDMTCLAISCSRQEEMPLREKIT